MERWQWLLLGAFILVVVIIIIVVLVMVFDRGPVGPSGPTGMTGQTGSNGPCGNATVFDQLCLLNGVVVTFTSQQTGGMMGICQGDILNSPDNWCVDAGTLNLVSTSPNINNSTSWQVLRSTDNRFIAFQNIATGQYLNVEAFWPTCSPCTFGFGCNNPVSVWQTDLDPNNYDSQPSSWFTMNILDLGNFTVQIIPLQSNLYGYIGSNSNQMNSNSCLDMVTANYTISEAATRWTLDYVG